MKISDAMKKDIIKVKRSLSLRALLSMFKDFQTPPLIPVVDDQDNLIGMVHTKSLLDLLRPQQTKLFRNVPFAEVDEYVFDLELVPSMGELIIVDDIMDTNFTSIKESDSLEDAYKALHLSQKERLPVVNGKGKIIGIIGTFDIVWRMFKEKGIV